MDKAVQHFVDQLVGICGSATPGFVGTIKVDYQGQKTPISLLASTFPQQGRIAVSPFDPSMLKEVEKALKDSGLNAYIFNKTTVVVALPKFISTADLERAIAKCVG